VSLAQHAATWLGRLVQIPSVTPIQAGPRAGEPGEQRIADALTAWFHDLDGHVEIDVVEPGRPNVYGLWPGESDTWFAVDVHVDTVGVEQMTGEPFSGELRDGCIWGRGAVDTKATLGVLLALLEKMQTTGQRARPSLLIGATVDEEVGTTGAPAFASWIARQNFSVAQLIVAEPTCCIPVYGHRGVARFELNFIGKAAHSAQPDLGCNALVGAARTILAYAGEHQRLQEIAPTALGHPSLTSTIIHGGTGINVVPASCSLSVDRRVVNGEDASEVTDGLYALAQQHAGLPVELTRQREINAFLQPPDSAWIRQLAQWSDSTPQIAPYGTNAWAYSDLPGETVVIGPGSIDQAHGEREWVELAELEKITQIYARWWGLNL
jgi:acetylornithine deacetylase/succinyl-diaminopimelate desuccinylase-like protein